jgi:hypothetical protein
MERRCLRGAEPDPIKTHIILFKNDINKAHHLGTALAKEYT